MSSRSLARKHFAFKREIGYESRIADFDLRELKQASPGLTRSFLVRLFTAIDRGVAKSGRCVVK
jgi:hypothetical protein